MAGSFSFRRHPAWEDWANIVLGILIAVAPWFFGHTQFDAVTINALIVGLVVVVIAGFEFVDQNRWEEFVSLLAGVWLMISPTALGYGGRPAQAAIVLGAARGAALGARAVAGVEPRGIDDTLIVTRPCVAP